MDMKSIISKIKLSNGKIDINLLDKLNLTSQQYDSVAKYVLENGLEFEEEEEDFDYKNMYLDGISSKKEDLDIEKLYFMEVYSKRILTPKEEVELAARVAQGDQQAREELINANLRLVAKMAKKYYSSGLEFLDLISAGNEGLVKAVDKFDVNKGFRFSTYAVWWIRQSIVRVIHEEGNLIRIPVHANERLDKFVKEQRRLEQEFGGTLTREELAKLMGITVDRVIYYEKLSVKPKSLDESVEVDYGNERKTTLADFVASDEPTPEEIVINSAVEDMIRECVSELTPREQEILWARLDKTLEEVGEMFGLTRERIRQIEKRAIKKLRNPLSKVIGGK